MTLLGRVTFGGYVRTRINKHREHCTGPPGNVICGHADSRQQYRRRRAKLPYLENAFTLPWYSESAPEGPLGTLPSQVKSSMDLGESYPTMVGLLDVMSTASYGTKRATERAGGLQTSCNFGKIILTSPSGPHVGTARQHSQVVKLLAS